MGVVSLCLLVSAFFTGMLATGALMSYSTLASTKAVLRFAAYAVFGPPAPKQQPQHLQQQQQLVPPQHTSELQHAANSSTNGQGQPLSRNHSPPKEQHAAPLALPPIRTFKPPRGPWPLRPAATDPQAATVNLDGPFANTPLSPEEEAGNDARATTHSPPPAPVEDREAAVLTPTFSQEAPTSAAAVNSHSLSLPGHGSGTEAGAGSGGGVVRRPAGCAVGRMGVARAGGAGVFLNPERWPTRLVLSASFFTLCPFNTLVCRAQSRFRPLRLTRKRPAPAPAA